MNIFRKFSDVLGYIIPMFLFSALAKAADTGINFNYSESVNAASSMGWGQTILSTINTFLLVIAGLGVLSLGWVGIELAFLGKEINEVKKGLIGVIITIVGPSLVWLALNNITNFTGGR